MRLAHPLGIILLVLVGSLLRSTSTFAADAPEVRKGVIFRLVSVNEKFWDSAKAFSIVQMNVDGSLASSDGTPITVEQAGDIILDQLKDKSKPPMAYLVIDILEEKTSLRALKPVMSKLKDIVPKGSTAVVFVRYRE
jgi:hypothetical protein